MNNTVSKITLSKLCKYNIICAMDLESISNLNLSIPSHLLDEMVSIDNSINSILTDTNNQLQNNIARIENLQTIKNKLQKKCEPKYCCFRQILISNNIQNLQRLNLISSNLDYALNIYQWKRCQINRQYKLLLQEKLQLPIRLPNIIE